MCESSSVTMLVLLGFFLSGVLSQYWVWVLMQNKKGGKENFMHIDKGGSLECLGDGWQDINSNLIANGGKRFCIYTNVFVRIL